MKRTIVVADIHQNHAKVQKLLETMEFDRCILLGDFFDQFHDFPEDSRQTAIWLKEKVFSDPRFVVLVGNHDLSYYFAFNKNAWCSGFSHLKRQAIFEVLTYDEILDRVKFFHVEDGFLFSHAGITNAVWKEMRMMEPDGAKLLDVLPKWIERSLTGVRTLQHMPLFEAGWSRGGRQQHGGILWADWSEFSPVSGVNQIVGHTPHEVPEITVKLAGGAVKHYNAVEWAYNKHAVLAKQLQSVNYALDTHLNHFMVITDGDVELWDWNTMLPMKEGSIITSATGAEFVPERQLHQPDFGVFRIAGPQGVTNEITGKELCDLNNFFMASASNVMMLLSKQLKDGNRVTFLRRKKKIRGQPDPEKLNVTPFSAEGQEPPEWYSNTETKLDEPTTTS